MDDKNIIATQGLIDFIEKSPTAFHVTANAAAMLREAGFEPLCEKQRFNLKPGGKYYVTRNSSSLIAFCLPGGAAEGFSLIGAHTDSPAFKLKDRAEIGQLCTVLNTEAYGGMLMAPWFDRPLSLAGRAFVDAGGKMEERLVDIDRDLCLIPSLAIHQNRDANHGIDYKVQRDLHPLIASDNRPGLVSRIICAKLGIDEADLADAELFLYSRSKGTIWGAGNEYFSAPRIDDQQCAYCAIKALIASAPSEKVRMAVLFDNEEVGSTTRQGAMGDFLAATASRIAAFYGWDAEDYAASRSRSMMLSADNSHAVHPNYPETSDPTSTVKMNGGVVLKYSGNQKYSTDGFSGASFKSLMKKHNLPMQVFYNNSDQPGGSTLGNLSETQFSIPCADIGCAQLAMHSPYETAGTADTLIMIQAMQAFFEEN